MNEQIQTNEPQICSTLKQLDVIGNDLGSNLNNLEDRLQSVLTPNSPEVEQEAKELEEPVPLNRELKKVVMLLRYKLNQVISILNRLQI